jgi:hypothetical protein
MGRVVSRNRVKQSRHPYTRLLRGPTPGICHVGHLQTLQVARPSLITTSRSWALSWGRKLRGHLGLDSRTRLARVSTLMPAPVEAIWTLNATLVLGGPEGLGLASRHSYWLRLSAMTLSGMRPCSFSKKAVTSSGRDVLGGM